MAVVLLSDVLATNPFPDSFSVPLYRVLRLAEVVLVSQLPLLFEWPVARPQNRETTVLGLRSAELPVRNEFVFHRLSLLGLREIHFQFVVVWQHKLIHFGRAASLIVSLDGDVFRLGFN